MLEVRPCIIGHDAFLNVLNVFDVISLLKHFPSLNDFPRAPPSNKSYHYLFGSILYPLSMKISYYLSDSVAPEAFLDLNNSTALPSMGHP